MFRHSKTIGFIETSKKQMHCAAGALLKVSLESCLESHVIHGNTFPQKGTTVTACYKYTRIPESRQAKNKTHHYAQKNPVSPQWLRVKPSIMITLALQGLHYFTAHQLTTSMSIPCCTAATCFSGHNSSENQSETPLSLLKSPTLGKSYQALS